MVNKVVVCTAEFPDSVAYCGEQCIFPRYGYGVHASTSASTPSGENTTVGQCSSRDHSRPPPGTTQLAADTTSWFCPGWGSDS